ncbi:MAG: hypothetical protein PHV74_00095 [Dehalococcoidia bacterium]|nr:hypothetical protein [Dehalococcoidia bacterium]
MGAETTLEILLKFKDEASKGLEGTVTKLGGLDQTLKKVGGALTGFGVGMAGVLVMATKAAADEEAGIIKLSSALKNVGVNYDKVKGSLEKTIAATTKKTAVSDDDQRKALAALVEITGDYNVAMKMLPLTLDVAVAKSMDYTSAAQIVGRVSTGNTEILTRYGIELGKGATATQALGQLQAKFGGQAEAYGQSTAGAMANVQNSFSDLMEEAGTTFIPVAKDLLGVLNTVMGWFQDMPSPIQKVIIVTVLLAGGFALIAGPLMLLIGMLPALAAGIGLVGAAFTLLTGPVGLVCLAITAVVAAGILLWRNWDKISGFAKTIWGGIMDIFNRVKDTVLGVYNSGFGWLLPGGAIYKAFTMFKDELKKVADVVTFLPSKVGGAIGDVAGKVGGFFGSMNPFHKKHAKEAEDAYDEMAADIKLKAEALTATLKDQLDQQLKDQLAVIEEKRKAAEQEYDDAVAKIREEYGVTEEYHQSKIDLARQATDDMKQQLDEELDAARTACNEKLALLDKEYAAKFKLLDQDTQAAVQKYQDQIDAIDARTKDENRILEDQQNQKRLLELQDKVAQADNDADRASATEDLNEFIAQVERDKLLDSREAEKEALRDSIENVRTEAENKKTALQEELEAKKTHESEMLKETETRLANEKTALDAALQQKLAQIAEEASWAVFAENIKLAATKQRLVDEETETKASHARQVTEEALYQKALIAAKQQVLDEQAKSQGIYGPYISDLPVSSPIYGHATGGLITEPTLMYGLRTGRRGIMAEQGSEWIVPDSKMKSGGIVNTITQHFHIAQMIIREEADIQRVAEALFDLQKSAMRSGA